MARKRPKRTRVERGIFADKYGYSAIVTAHGLQHEKRFPLDTDREDMRQWRNRERVVLDQDYQGLGLTARRHTLEHDVRLYLTRRIGRPGFAADRSHLKAWTKTLGARSRRTLNEQDLEAVIGTWRQAKVAPQTIKHRVRALRQLYRALDGPDARHPLRHLKLSKPIRSAPTPVDSAVIRTVAKNLKAGDAKDYARFLVRATTGQRPAAIMTTKPGDVDLTQRLWFVRPAKGGDPIPLPLNAGMVRAWKAFAKADAWGTFDTSDHADALRDAGWPKGIRPYDLRHTFAIDLLLGGADLGDVQGLLGHADIQTTRQFYAPILVSRLTKAVKRRRLILA